MSSSISQRAWAAAAAIFVAGALFSLPQPSPSAAALNFFCNASAPDCTGSCDGGNTTVCYGEPVGNASACSCVLTGCCRDLGNTTACEDQVPQPACAGGVFVANGSCANDCRIPDGGACADPTDCVSGNCVDDVCCDTICNLPGQECNLPAAPGVCTSTAARAPAASPTGLMIGLVLLIGVGALALFRRTRTH